MKLEKQVSCLELSKQLNELGVKQDSVFGWTDEGLGGKWHVVPTDQGDWDGYYCVPIKVAAFTVAELGEMIGVESDLPWYGRMEDGESLWLHDSAVVTYSTEADARAALLIRLIEKGSVKP